MTRPVAVVVALAAMLPAFGRTAARAQDNRPLDPKVIAWDKGPDKIDVSKYPAEMKQRYKVFSDLCSRCHTLARAVNCDFALEDEWERYIKKMMRRGGHMISPGEAEQIFDFVVYDSKVRKKTLYETKLAQAR
jgi:cytochrome c5